MTIKERTPALDALATLLVPIIALMLVIMSQQEGEDREYPTHVRSTIGQCPEDHKFGEKRLRGYESIFCLYV